MVLQTEPRRHSRHLLDSLNHILYAFFLLVTLSITLFYNVLYVIRTTPLSCHALIRHFTKCTQLLFSLWRSWLQSLLRCRQERLLMESIQRILKVWVGITLSVQIRLNLDHVHLSSCRYFHICSVPIYGMHIESGHRVGTTVSLGQLVFTGHSVYVSSDEGLQCEGLWRL